VSGTGAMGFDGGLRNLALDIFGLMIVLQVN
jgi:hypothetical protein